eukprot:g28249.t1
MGEPLLAGFHVATLFLAQVDSTTSGAARRRQAKEKAAATGTPSDKVAGLEAVKDSLTEPAPSAPAVEIFGKDASEFKPWDTFELVQQGSAKAKLPQVLISYMAKFKAFKDRTRRLTDFSR